MLLLALHIAKGFTTMAADLGVTGRRVKAGFAVAGGLGIREFTLVAILSTFDVSPELALAFSFLLLLRNLTLSLLGGVAEAFDFFGVKRLSEAPRPEIKEP